MDNITSTLQTSKKVLIFFYIVCIFIFIAVSLGLLYLKSNYFAAQLDIAARQALNDNPSYAFGYKTMDGDLLSKMTVSDLRARLKSGRPDSRPIGLVREISLSLFPLSHLHRYIMADGIPADLKISGLALVVPGGTAEINALAAKLHYRRSNGHGRIEYAGAFDLSMPGLCSLLGETVKATGEIGLENHFGAGTFKCNAIALDLPPAWGNGATIGVGLSKTALAFDSRKGEASLSLDALGGSAGIKATDLQNAGSPFTLEVSLRDISTKAIFRSYPVAPVLVCADSVEASIIYRGRPALPLEGNGRAAVRMSGVELLEYRTDENRLFTPQGFGEFVVSLGLTPELSSRAGTLEISAELDGATVSVSAVKIRSPHYDFEANATIGPRGELGGKAKLHLPAAVLAKNTLGVDFSAFPDGFSIYGRVMGDVSNPFVMYDMDREALFRITRDVLYKKFMEKFGGGK